MTSSCSTVYEGALTHTVHPHCSSNSSGMDPNLAMQTTKSDSASQNLLKSMSLKTLYISCYTITVCTPPSISAMKNMLNPQNTISYTHFGQPITLYIQFRQLEPKIWIPSNPRQFEHFQCRQLREVGLRDIKQMRRHDLYERASDCGIADLKSCKRGCCR